MPESAAPPVVPPAASSAPRSAPRTARERVRRELTSEIKEVALAQLESGGGATLSLRAIAREMGMASSALFRYFRNRDAMERIAVGFVACPRDSSTVRPTTGAICRTCAINSSNCGPATDASSSRSSIV